MFIQISCFRSLMKLYVKIPVKVLLMYIFTYPIKYRCRIVGLQLLSMSIYLLVLSRYVLSYGDQSRTAHTEWVFDTIIKILNVHTFWLCSLCITYSAKMYSKMPNLINKWSSSVVVIYNLSSEVGCDYRVSLFASHVTSYSWLVSLKGSNINNIHKKLDWSWNQQPNLANLVLTSPCRCPVVVVDL